MTDCRAFVIARECSSVITDGLSLSVCLSVSNILKLRHLCIVQIDCLPGPELWVEGLSQLSCLVILCNDIPPCFGQSTSKEVGPANFGLAFKGCYN